MGKNGTGKGPELGLAMIVRNGAATMERALEPFVNVVDEAVIVLGGDSSDDTAGVAEAWCDRAGPERFVVLEYEGPLDQEGRLLDFADARQVATDGLSAPWMIVVDADDVWEGVEYVRAIIRDVDDQAMGMVQFPYQVGKGEFLQPRLFRRESGRWRSPVHEYWDLETGWKVAQTNLVRLEQRREDPSTPSTGSPSTGSGQGGRGGRGGHNIGIAEAWLEVHPEDTRTLALLGRDYLDAERYEDALRVLNQFLVLRKHGQGAEDQEREFEAHYCRGAAFLHLERYADALQAGTMALSVRPYGMAWTLMAEAALLLARATRAGEVYEMVVMFADRAMAAGRQRSTAWSSAEMVTKIPLLLKSQALIPLGRNREALAALDMALALDPEYEEATRLRAQLCQAVGVLA